MHLYKCIYINVHMVLTKKSVLFSKSCTSYIVNIYLGCLWWCMISQAPSSSQHKNHFIGKLEERIRMVEMSLISHSFQLEDTQPSVDVDGEEERLGLFDRRLSSIEKVLLDNGLMQPDDIADTYTVPSEVITISYLLIYKFNYCISYLQSLLRWSTNL